MCESMGVSVRVREREYVCERVCVTENVSVRVCGRVRE